jgi:hypothetical protein
MFLVRENVEVAEQQSKWQNKQWLCYVNSAVPRSKDTDFY